MKRGNIFLLVIIIYLMAWKMRKVNGIQCASTGDCEKNEICTRNSCECLSEHVTVSGKCFRIKKYGEECQFDRECADSRMICTNDDSDGQQKTFCRCDPYHMWNSTVEECLDIGNITQAAGNFREAHNVAGILEKSAQKVFLGVVIAGLISVSVLLTFVGICSVYGCCSRWKKQRYGGNHTRNKINEIAVIRLPSGRYATKETDFAAIAV